MNDGGNPTSAYTHLLDAAITAAIERAIAAFGLTEDDLARGFQELSKLRTLTPNVDYSDRCTAVAYGFKYVAIRASSIIVALDAMPADRAVGRVLDLGSGSDATSLALGLWRPAQDFAVTTLEPALGMTSFARQLDCGPSVRRFRGPGTLQDIASGKFHLSSSHYDLAVLSACLQRELWEWGDDEWTSFVDHIRQALKPKGSIIQIEPPPKRALSRRLRAAFFASGGFIIQDVQNGPGQPDVLIECSTLLRSKYGAGILASSNLDEDGRYFVGSPPWNVENWHADDVITLFLRC